MMKSSVKLESVFLMLPLQIPWAIYPPVFLLPPPLSLDSRRTRSVGVTAAKTILIAGSTQSHAKSCV